MTEKAKAMKAIETRYAGCRFRSRLEARYAVLFDTLGIAWEYEPEGYVVGGRPYLPDFYLPACQVWVEVKGSNDALDAELLKAAARELPGRRGKVGYPTLIVFGPLRMPGPDPAFSEPGQPVVSFPAHTTLGTHGDAVFRGAAEIEPARVGTDGGPKGGGVCSCRSPLIFGADEDPDGQYWNPDDGSRAVLYGGWLAGASILTAPESAADVDNREVAIAHGYLHANSARFEHGEKG